MTDNLINTIYDILPDAEKKDIDEEPRMSIAQVRQFIKTNSTQESSQSDFFVIDPELIYLIDPRIDFNIFICDNDIFSIDELNNNYAFKELKIVPESLFSQQMFAIFPNDEYAIKGADDEYFTCARVTGGAATSTAAPIKSVLTKFYIGGSKWKDFLLLNKLAKASQNVLKRSLLALPAPVAPQVQTDIQVAPVLPIPSAASAAPDVTRSTIEDQKALLIMQQMIIEQYEVEMTKQSLIIEKYKTLLDERIKKVESLLINIQ